MNEGQATLKSLWRRVTEKAKPPAKLIKRPALRQKIGKLLEAVSDQMFPAGGAIPYSARDVGLSEYIVDFLGKIPTDKSNMICALILAYEYAFPPLFLKGFRFTTLSPEKQFELLEELHDADIYLFRILNLVIRMFVTFGYMADERVMAEMGYFKLHDYPADHRLIQILKDLPWEVRKAPENEDERESLTATEAIEA